jgi:mannosyltransferase OCH1-like enzyme
MIPKTIHYCWFGGKEKPEAVKKCIESWKKYCPDYTIIEWNEFNFDTTYNKYTTDSYILGKYAYTSDVARLWALYNFGGIYMDTDVQVYQSLDKFLEYFFFTGFESAHYPVTAVMGAEKGNELIKEMLDVYDKKIFKTHENWHDYETNTMIMSDIIGKYFERDVPALQIKDNMAIYPPETFCTHVDLTKDVYAQHLMLGSWG